MKKLPLLLIVLIVLTIVGGTGTFYYYSRATDAVREVGLAAEEAGQVQQLKRKVRNLEDEIAELKREKDTLKTEIKASSTDKPTELRSTSGKTYVTSPLENDLVKNPFKVTGRAIAFENRVRIRVKDADGRVLVEKAITTNAPDAGKFGNFDVELDIRSALTKSGTVEVAPISAKDGSDIDMVIIPVKFRQ